MDPHDTLPQGQDPESDGTPQPQNDARYGIDAQAGIDTDTDADPAHDPGKLSRMSGMFHNWFLDYASYVILERAVPHLDDGLKPVQRRILHAMRRMEDGRYNKVANVIGSAMQFHPHGDASIGDALVQLGQKDLLIDTQGNWGNILTGDGAAAPRYIEARLSKFALEAAFNPKTTQWKLSYDGRNEEPVTLPVKFPLLLAQGVEGIAVGLASKILPHNFLEIIDACVAHLRGEPFALYPDFPTGGLADVSHYNDGLRGGTVKVRARITKEDNRTVKITEIPYGTTSQSIIDSIVKANEKGKIRVKRVDDNTAARIEILVHLQAGVSPDQTIDALYACTDCETSLSPNACVIDGDKPRFMPVSQMLRHSADRTLRLLEAELRIRLAELAEEWHLSSLEKIFFEEHIYRELERDVDTWEQVVEAIDRGFDPFRGRLRREITRDDLLKLTEKPVRKISKFDIKKADEHIRELEAEIAQVEDNIAHIVDYTVRWYRQLAKKFGKGRERRTELRDFENIVATQVVVANEKLYANYKEGFVGTALKKEEFVCECSDIDDIIVFCANGKYRVTKVEGKTFIDKEIIHAAVWRKTDMRTTYNAVYRDGLGGAYYVKRFQVRNVTRDRDYDVTQGKPGSKIVYFSANPNGEAETVKVFLKPKLKLKKLCYTFDFSTLAIKGRQSMGNALSKHEVHKITLQERGASTLGGLKIWFDTAVRRLNVNGAGQFLGEFAGQDRVVVFYQNGSYATTGFELANRYEEGILRIEKYDPSHVYTCAFYDAEQQFAYLKRFRAEDTGRGQSFIGEAAGSRVLHLGRNPEPVLEVRFGGAALGRALERVEAAGFIGVKSDKARGKRLSNYPVEAVTELTDPFPAAPDPAPAAAPDSDPDTDAAPEEHSLFE